MNHFFIAGNRVYLSLHNEIVIQKTQGKREDEKQGVVIVEKKKLGDAAMIFVAAIDATEDLNDQIMGFIIPTPLV